jgi:TRAP-type C4-dicarboxylate transport system permease small subunit
MKTAIDRLTRIAGWIAGLLFMGLFGLNVVQITLRYLFGATWLWVPDLLRLMFVWMVFLGATVLYAAGEHLMVDFFVRRMPARRRHAVAAAVEAAAIAFCGILIVKGIEITQRRMRVPFDTWDVPTGYAYAAIVVAGALMGLIAAWRLAGHVRCCFGKGESPDVERE